MRPYVNGIENLNACDHINRMGRACHKKLQQLSMHRVGDLMVMLERDRDFYHFHTFIRNTAGIQLSKDDIAIAYFHILYLLAGRATYI